MSDATKDRLHAAVRPGRRFDFAWLLLVATLVATTPETNYNLIILLLIFGIFQVAEPRIKPLSTRLGQVVSILLKLVFSYLLIGYTHTVFSPYYPIFLIPIVSAATILELPAVILVTAVACLAYVSFLLPFFLPVGFEFPPGYMSTICARLSFYAIVAFLVYQQAKAKRDEIFRAREAAERLAESNMHLREAQASLRRSERLAALGQLTAGLAHELRNPLGTIRASAEMLTKASTQNRPLVMSEMAGFIESEVDRVNGLISNFLDFARPLQIHPKLSDLSTVFDDVVRQNTALAQSCSVNLTVQFEQSIQPFAFDPDLLKLALGNLIQNAIQASAPGAVVSLEAVNRDEGVIVSVIDHGEGIKREHLESIFNPFFTTKSKGVGLGLAIVSKIVDEHGGKIEVSSEVGRGTTFELMLPNVQHLSV